MLNKHEAVLGGRVVFYTRPTSLKVSLDWSRLEKLVEGIEHEVKELPSGVTTMLYLITSTERIEFKFEGTETTLLTDFQAMWEGLRPYTVESVTRALDWALNGAIAIRDEWVAAIERSNALWIDPVEAPIEQLAPALQEAVTNPENPTSPAASKENRKILSASTA